MFLSLPTLERESNQNQSSQHLSSRSVSPAKQNHTSSVSGSLRGSAELQDTPTTKNAREDPSSP